MGHLKDIANQPKLQTFPSARFEIVGEVPASQCTEAQVEGDHGQTFDHGNALIDPNNFIGWALAGKKLTITFPPPNAGTYNIIFNDASVLVINPNTPFASLNNRYFVHNGGELILTRNVQSFAEFISAAGYAYTIKGGKLYTNITSFNLQPACSILFDPLT